jgi:hypothetical protein
MIQIVLSAFAAIVLAASFAEPVQAQKTKSSNRPSGAHVAISIGDGNTIEAKSGKAKKKSGADMRPWTTTHGTNSRP